MKKLVFSSDHLPPELSDIQRFGLWQDLFCQNIAQSEFWISPAPFHAHMEMVAVGGVNLARMSGSIVRSRHGSSLSTPGTAERVGLLINTTDALIQLRHRNRETIVQAGGAVLISLAEAGELTSSKPVNEWFVLDMPGPGDEAGVHIAQDKIGQALAPDGESLALIRGYASLMLAHGPADDLVAAHIARTITGLVALALKAREVHGDIGPRPGLAAARLDAVLQEIAQGFEEPEFSAAIVALRLRLSARYVQKLLHATGTSFAERVLELRLQRACHLLALADGHHRKISDVALAAGFSDLSYFHACFRRRFGMTPAGLRPK